LAKTKH